LKDTGFIEGETVPIEYRLAENQIERLLALATELVRRQVAAIAGPITSALVARAAIITIPIVSVAGEDPVTLGLMTSLARPGGKVTTHTAHV
jgi:putative ABC transport system substrate-binding protein